MKLLTRIGLNAYQKIDSVTSDFVSAPEGLAHLVTKDADDIDAGNHNYQNRMVLRERFNMMSIQVKRLKYLMFRVQDRHKFQENLEFPDVIT